MSFFHDFELDFIEWEVVKDDINRKRYESMIWQSEKWLPEIGGEVLVSRMDITHVQSLILWLEKNYGHYQDRYHVTGKRLELEATPLYVRLKARLEGLMGGFGLVYD